MNCRFCSICVDLSTDNIAFVFTKRLKRKDNERNYQTL